MKLLKDDELVPLVIGANPILTDHQYAGDWYAKLSPVQPCSIDLTIGAIYLPGAKSDETGGAQAPVESRNLRPGQTAIMTTKETLHLRSNLAAIGFPPSHVSFQGLLMTNPGHVDPGYVGPMHFTVINMGSQEYPLRRNAPIVTLLVFELSDNSHRDWRARGNEAAPIRQESIDALSRDFLDVTRRATEITEKGVKDATFRTTWIGGAFTAVVALVGFASASFMPAWRYDLEKQMAGIKEWSNVVKTEARVASLESDLAAIKAVTCKQSPRLSYCPPAPSTAIKP